MNFEDSSFKKVKVKDIKKFIAENSLSIAFIVLFCIFLTCQYYTGYLYYNDTQQAYHRPMASHWQYFTSGHFLDAVFVNWQAAILQLGSLILFSIFLVQRGDPHSKKRGEKKKKEEENFYQGFRKFIHNNSLSLAFGALFVVAFLLHFYFSHKSINHLRNLAHESPVSLSKYAISSSFWYLTFQTWQAEFMAIALYIILSIFLRQKDSPESKPTEAGNKDTGDPNK